MIKKIFLFILCTILFSIIMWNKTPSQQPLSDSAYTNVVQDVELVETLKMFHIKTGLRPYVFIESEFTPDTNVATVKDADILYSKFYATPELLINGFADQESPTLCGYMILCFKLAKQNIVNTFIIALRGLNIGISIIWSSIIFMMFSFAGKFK